MGGLVVVVVVQGEAEGGNERGGEAIHLHIPVRLITRRVSVWH